MGNVLNIKGNAWLYLVIIFCPSESQNPQPHCLWPALSGPCEHCEKGWYGDYCEYNCINCDIGDCLKDNGTCLQCRHGYYSQKCDRHCPANCRESYDEKVYCDRKTGNCLEYCKHGWWGDRCEKRCSDSCVDNACFFYDGSCIKDCRKGWFGKKCNRPCPAGCLNGHCARYRTGQCTDGCKKGYHGNHCNKRCNQHCINQDCFLDANLKSVVCRKGCNNGWWSQACRSKCPKNCNSCDRESGECRECKTGFWGANCQRFCSDKCFNKTCDTGGRCTRCKRGYKGEYCQTDCGDKCMSCMDVYEPCQCQEQCRDVPECLHDGKSLEGPKCKLEDSQNRKSTMSLNSGHTNQWDLLLYACLLLTSLQRLC